MGAGGFTEEVTELGLCRPVEPAGQMEGEEVEEHLALSLEDGKESGQFRGSRGSLGMLWGQHGLSWLLTP